jgi:hypothetical protein
LNYIQWHNLAFEATSLLNLSTLVLLNDDYENNYELNRNKVLNFLGFPSGGFDEMVQPVKTFPEFYTDEQKAAIRDFIQAAASGEAQLSIAPYLLQL